MKRAVIAALTILMSCRDNPRIVPDAIESVSENGPRFVNAPAVGASGSRLRRIMVTSADGLSIPNGSIYDSILGDDCSIVDTPSGKQCVPHAVQFGVYFADSSCSIPTVNAPPGCAAPTYATRYESNGDTCADVGLYRIYDIGPKLPTAYRQIGTSCVQWSAEESSTMDVFPVGPEVDYSVFATVLVAPE